jgi:hypothetical protein
MSFDVSPLGGAVPAGRAVDGERPKQDPAAAASFADALDTASTPPIPEEVWDQVDAASRLADVLHASGHGLRFDVHRLDGGVVAELVDGEGESLAPLPLADVIDITRLAREIDRKQP